VPVVPRRVAGGAPCIGHLESQEGGRWYVNGEVRAQPGCLKGQSRRPEAQGLALLSGCNPLGGRGNRAPVPPPLNLGRRRFPPCNNSQDGRPDGKPQQGDIPCVGGGHETSRASCIATHRSIVCFGWHWRGGGVLPHGGRDHETHRGPSLMWQTHHYPGPMDYGAVIQSGQSMAASVDSGRDCLPFERRCGKS